MFDSANRETSYTEMAEAPPSKWMRHRRRGMLAQTYAARRWHVESPKLSGKGPGCVFWQVNHKFKVNMIASCSGAALVGVARGMIAM
jgi:hypothetical protein